MVVTLSRRLPDNLSAASFLLMSAVIVGGEEGSEGGSVVTSGGCHVFLCVSWKKMDEKNDGRSEEGLRYVGGVVFDPMREFPLRILKEMSSKLVLLSVLALTFSYLALAYEPSSLQDFCVADPNSSVKVNGVTCKNPMQVQAEDFFFSGLHLRGNTSNQLGSKVTQCLLLSYQD
ncbi:unnamed protein product [Lactuca saligna]|uniref:Uncharacterized protein n=1 Tax=Lactuca saligna TaxID=75948 RepID=A0AA35Y6U9_LACSI|nr:unnamed protein product [Lactuca saligna]